jgi:hypothetical protein
MTEGSRSSHALKNSGPCRCPRGYRGGTAAGVRSNTFNTTRLPALAVHPGNAGRGTGPEFSYSNQRRKGAASKESVWASSHGFCVPGPAQGSSPCRAALLRGGSAPDALRHRLKSVGQAVRADVATAADRLRRFSLPRRRARCRRDGKEQLGIRLPAGAARHPAPGTRSGRYGQYWLRRSGHVRASGNSPKLATGVWSSPTLRS